MTLIYTRLVNFGRDRYVHKVAKTVDDHVKLVEAEIEGA